MEKTAWEKLGGGKKMKLKINLKKLQIQFLKHMKIYFMKFLPLEAINKYDAKTSIQHLLGQDLGKTEIRKCNVIIAGMVGKKPLAYIMIQFQDSQNLVFNHFLNLVV